MIALIDYGMGNLHSVAKALEIVGGEVKIITKPEELKNAQRIVLPGVGSFAQGIAHLRQMNLVDTLNHEVIVNKKPFLGICLGMQLAAKVGYEHGTNEGLGWFNAQVVALNPSLPECKIPHMGWNDVQFSQSSPLFKGLKNPSTFYFVHSYHFVLNECDWAVGLCQHGAPFIAAVSRENIHLVQFHPEKSQQLGLQVLENFVNL